MTDAATDILAMHARMSPDRPALIDEDGTSLSYAALNASVNRCASALAGLGVGRGDRCAHLHHNCLDAFRLGHALRKLQVVTTPLNWRLRGEEIAHLLEDSDPRVVVCGPEFIDVAADARGRLAAAATGCHWVALGSQAPPGWTAFDELLEVGVDEEPPAPPEMTGPTMVYTAGTTGRPKGAYRSGGIDAGIVLQYIGEFGLRREDVHLLAGPGYHSAPAVFGGLQQIIGATTVVMHRFHPERALALIDRHRVTTTFMAPILVRRILDLPEALRRRHDVSSLRSLVVAAAPFSPDLKRRAREYFGDCVYEFYGASETGIVSVMPPADLLRKPASCGRLLDGVELRLLDDDGAEVPAGEPGEIWTRSAGTFSEYYNRPDATAASRRDGFVSVGDVGFVDDEGFLHICDRKVDMVISGGVNIYPADIEGVLGEHPAVEDCAVIGVPDEEWGEVVRAVVRLRDGWTATAAELEDHVGARLAAYKRPRGVDFVDEFPRDAAGKLLKRLVRDPYWAHAGRRV